MAYDRRGGRGGFRRFGGRPRFGGGGFDIPKPVKVGEEYDVEIDEVGSKGDGIARIKNFVVFVSGAKKGEKIKIKITEVGGRFAIAEKVGPATGAEAAEAAEAAEPEAEAAKAEPDAAEAGVEAAEPEAAEAEPEAVEAEAEPEAAETEEAVEEAEKA